MLVAAFPACGIRKRLRCAAKSCKHRAAKGGHSGRCPVEWLGPAVWHRSGQKRKRSDVLLCMIQAMCARGHLIREVRQGQGNNMDRDMKVTRDCRLHKPAQRWLRGACCRSCRRLRCLKRQRCCCGCHRRCCLLLAATACSGLERCCGGGCRICCADKEARLHEEERRHAQQAAHCHAESGAAQLRPADLRHLLLQHAAGG